MRIDMKRQAELNQRKGLSRRTALSVAWLALCFVFAYLVTGWLIGNGPLDAGFVYGTLGLPTEVDMQIVRAVVIMLLVVTFQFLAVIFFAVTNPAARVRSGRPTATAQSVDYYEKQYNRRA